MRSRLELVGPMLFVVGLLCLALLYGVFAGMNDLFPTKLVARSEEAARAFWKIYVSGDEISSKNFVVEARPGAPRGVVVHDRSRMASGVTLLVGYRADGFQAWLMDLEGRTLHKWQIGFDEAFPEKPHLLWSVGGDALAWHGVHLYPNGDLLFNFTGQSSFPYGSGMVKLDKDSNVVWRLAQNTHHDVTVAEDGTIWAPSQLYREQGLPELRNLEPWYYEDTILKISPDGEVLDEISLLKALAATYPGMLSLNHDDPIRVESIDPTHLNNVEPLPAALAANFPGFAAGDLMVSIRNTNAVAVIDPVRKVAKWVLTGPFVRQHDPDFLPNGNIVLFDNRGGADPACGHSRLLEIEPQSQRVVWQYGGCDDRPPFNSSARGSIQIAPNGNVLVAETNAGRAFEVTRDPEPRLVWEYYNTLDELDGSGDLGIITHVNRYPVESLTFLASQP